MNSIYFDCSRGLSGPMLVGALCDLGVAPSALEWDLGQVDVGEFHTHFERVTEDGLTGVKFSIHAGAVHTPEQDESHPTGHAHDHEHQHDHDSSEGGHDHEPHDQDAAAVHPVDKLIASVEASGLSDPVKSRVVTVFARLGQTHDALSLIEAAAVICASAALHALKPERVAFFCREGTMDATVDSGAAFAAEFVSTSAPLPALPAARVGHGIGSDGQSMSALIAEVAA